uniref:Uncharacterized protein n=1 Tax=Sarcinofilum mucosum TaxID=141643 RepID=A0A1W6EGE1_SARMC|nr:hypothetical protein [Sarcinofilum mucosum]ARK14464.1 hypothetical protein [Sarcinofilum mucosum]
MASSSASANHDCFDLPASDCFKWNYCSQTVYTVAADPFYGKSYHIASTSNFATSPAAYTLIFATSVFVVGTFSAVIKKIQTGRFFTSAEYSNEIALLVAYKNKTLSQNQAVLLLKKIMICL